jgi:serine protease Do
MAVAVGLVGGPSWSQSSRAAVPSVGQGTRAFSFAPAVARGAPAAVGIYSLIGHGDPEASGDDKVAVVGAGFLLSADGDIVTAAHVVGTARQVVVRLRGGRLLEAAVVGVDDDIDLALLKLSGSADAAPTFGRSSDLRPGDWVLAIGESFGMSQSVSAGIVSGHGRHLADEGETLFLQSDVALNPGSSGGPLLDATGRIVGMNVSRMLGSGGEGVSLTIPIEIVSQVAGELKGPPERRRPRLGAHYTDITPVQAVARGRSYAHGVVIVAIAEESLAARLGLREGDLVVGVNGRPIADSSDMVKALLAWRFDTKVRLTVFRERLPLVLALDL